MYEGNRLFCKQCKWYGKGNCKNIDHETIQLRPHVFNGYDGAYELCHICSFYEPKGYIKNPAFKNMEEYIEFLDTDYYETSKCHKREGYNNIRNFGYVTIRIPSEKVELQIHLYDWLTNTWRDGNKMKYKVLKRYETNKKGELIKIQTIDRPPLKEYGVYEIKNS